MAGKRPATRSKWPPTQSQISVAAKRRGDAWRACLAGLCLAQAWAGVSPAIAEDPCSAVGARRGLVLSVNERLELALNGGETLKIVGIDPPRPTPEDPDLDTKSRDRLASWLAGREVLFRPLGERHDRWGRTAALVFAAAGDPSSAVLSVGEALLDAGLARFEASADVRPCRAALLAAEASARATALGVWGDPYYAVIAAADRESFSEKAGTSVIVEGRVTHVDVGGVRMTLLFGPRRGWDFSLTILQRNIKKFDAAGLNLAGSAGRALRVRGLLDMQFGPQIEISGPDAVEVITQDRDEAAADPASPRR